MKKKGLNKKNIVIYVVIGLVLIFGVLFFLNDGNKEHTLICSGVEKDENFDLVTNISIEKTGNKIHLNYTGKFEIFANNETAQKFLSLYIQTQVSKLNEINNTIGTFNESENQITYTFDFDMDLLDENQVKDLIGVYSYDIKELKKHFENGGLTCEEN